jgi:coproporphyrinogen III oxidase
MFEQAILSFLKNLREEIIAEFQKLEDSNAVFERTSWDYKKGTGGGEMAVLRGHHFEKAAVNFSAVRGDTFPGSDGAGPFFATGISLITHMNNPHAPTVHMNLRFIETPNKKWLGGGYDLTPMGFSYPEDREHFHKIAKETLDPFGSHFYPQFSENAKNYFFIPHRNKERGVGGIFFDHFYSGDEKKDFLLWQAVGNTFLSAIVPIYKKRIHQTYAPKDKEIQLHLRAHYVEFNLLYDRGTKFGFLSGGNPDAILCSMPPVVKW